MKNTCVMVDVTKIEKRIKEIEAEPRALVGSDQGTHSTPLNHSVYEEITGERYAVASFGGANGSRCTEAEAKAETNGRLRDFPGETARIRGLQRELAKLRESLRKAGK